MEKVKCYKYMFIIGAVWNFSMSIPFIIISFIDMNLLTTLLGIQYSSTPLWLQSFFIFVLFFGIGYLWVGVKIDNNHAIIVLGTGLKILVFLFFLINYIIGELSLPFVLAGTVDFIFSLLFVEFLINHVRNK